MRYKTKMTFEERKQADFDRARSRAYGDKSRKVDKEEEIKSGWRLPAGMTMKDFIKFRKENGLSYPGMLDNI